jgi:hypothetical protein
MVTEAPVSINVFIPSWRFVLAMLFLLILVYGKLADMAVPAGVAKVDDQADDCPVKEQPDRSPTKADEQQGAAGHSHGTDNPDKWRFEGPVKMRLTAAKYHYP